MAPPRPVRRKPTPPNPDGFDLQDEKDTVLRKIGALRGAMETAGFEVPEDENDIPALFDAMLTLVKDFGESKAAKGDTMAGASMRRMFNISDSVSDHELVAMAERFGKLVAECDGVAGFAERLQAFETKDRARTIDDAIDRWERVNPPKINPNDKIRVGILREMAERMLDDTGNLDKFHAFMEREPAVLPMSGATRAPGESNTRRDDLIRRASREFNADDSLRRVTSARAFVNLELSEAGLERLKENEEWAIA